MKVTGSLTIGSKSSCLWRIMVYCLIGTICVCMEISSLLMSIYPTTLVASKTKIILNLYLKTLSWNLGVVVRLFL